MSKEPSGRSFAYLSDISSPSKCVINSLDFLNSLSNFLKINKRLPDLILLDILLEGHSAFALLNELQSYADTARIPVVVCSDLADELEMESLKHFNVRDIFEKSQFQPRELRERISEIINE